jgi:hypothetical protein
MQESRRAVNVLVHSNESIARLQNIHKTIFFIKKEGFFV